MLTKCLSDNKYHIYCLIRNSLMDFDYFDFFTLSKTPMATLIVPLASARFSSLEQNHIKFDSF